MCTVSFIPANDAIIITSNRDEHTRRQKASAPIVERINDKMIIFPRDTKAGGTWFAATDDGTVAVLLNGAFEKHISTPPYRRSRGLVLLDIISAKDPLSFFKETTLAGIEAFTVILYQQEVLHELRWDGDEKYEQVLNSSKKYIWSSSTLYSAEAIAHREHLFGFFILKNRNISAETIHDFHCGDRQDSENGFVIDRNGDMKTLSITQAIIKKDRIDIIHDDLLQEMRSEEAIIIKNSLISQ